MILNDPQRRAATPLESELLGFRCSCSSALWERRGCTRAASFCTRRLNGGLAWLRWDKVTATAAAVERKRWRAGVRLQLGSERQSSLDRTGNESARPASLRCVANDQAPAGAARAGTVYLVGAGPGPFELLTVKAVSLLRTTDVVLYDDLAQALLDDGFWDRIGRTNQPALTLSVGKQRYKQNEINDILVMQAKELHRSVVRLKCGDPSLFGRIHEEVAALRRAAVPFEVIPGVSSCTAAPITAGVFLTERHHGRNVLMLSGHDVSAIPYEAAARAADTIVLLMASRNLSAIASRFLHHLSPDLPVALCHTSYGLQWAGTLVEASTGEAMRALHDERTSELQATVAVIGAVVRQADLEMQHIASPKI
jgi:uroporphyrin-III C-methyltransferase